MIKKCYQCLITIIIICENHSALDSESINFRKIKEIQTIINPQQNIILAMLNLKSSKPDISA